MKPKKEIILLKLACQEASTTFLRHFSLNLSFCLFDFWRLCKVVSLSNGLPSDFLFSLGVKLFTNCISKFIFKPFKTYDEFWNRAIVHTACAIVQSVPLWIPIVCVVAKLHVRMSDSNCRFVINLKCLSILIDRKKEL